MKILHLTLKRKWFDMIASGEKKEEYREIKPYWIRRFCEDTWPSLISDLQRKVNPEYTDETVFDVMQRNFDVVCFRNGYSKNAPTITLEFKGIYIGPAKPEWSDNWQGDVFVIKLGEIISNN